MVADRIRAVYGAISGVGDSHGSAAAECQAATDECLAFIRSLNADNDGAWEQACQQYEDRWNKGIAQLSVAESDLKRAHDNGNETFNAADLRAASGFNV